MAAAEYRAVGVPDYSEVVVSYMQASPSLGLNWPKHTGWVAPSAHSLPN